MYLFPTQEGESDHIKKTASGQTIIRTYGLPMVFWGYLLAILGLIVIMFLAIKAPVEKLMATDDQINWWLGFSVYALLALIPSTLLVLYFYEKKLSKKDNLLTITHRIFYIPFMSKKVVLRPSEPFEVSHHLDSPNMAKIQGGEESRGFQNKGYFELFAYNEQDKKVFIDRHSRKVDLKKIAEILEK